MEQASCKATIAVPYLAPESKTQGRLLRLLGDSIREKHGTGPSVDQTGHLHRRVAFDYSGTCLLHIDSERNTVILDGQGYRARRKPMACL